MSKTNMLCLIFVCVIPLAVSQTLGYSENASGRDNDQNIATVVNTTKDVTTTTVDLKNNTEGNFSVTSYIVTTEFINTTEAEAPINDANSSGSKPMGLLEAMGLGETDGGAFLPWAGAIIICILLMLILCVGLCLWMEYTYESSFK